jgi:polyisoprenoid-binding protein YceI
MTKYVFDPAHTSVNFSLKHMMVTTVRGQFRQFDGALNYDADNIENSTVEAIIQVDSINTGQEQRDGHLRSPDFFGVETYPTMTFKSTKVEKTGDNTAKVTGDLTIRDVTKPVTLDVEFLGEHLSPLSGQKVLGFESTAKINREDFGLTWNQAIETGGVLIGKEVKINLDVQAVPAPQPETA